MQPLIDRFQTDIQEVVNKYRDQGLTYGEAIGTLEIVKMDLWYEKQNDEDWN